MRLCAPGCARIIAIGLGIIVATRTETGVEGGGMLVATGISVWLLNWFYRLGVRGDRERDREDRAGPTSTPTGAGPTTTSRCPSRTEAEAPRTGPPPSPHRTAPPAHRTGSDASRPTRRPSG
jgi:hypothetical protein